uniref:NDUFS8 n=1 Tax=Euglena gracilis TaxID=3039 RepID=UPI002FE4FB05
MQHLKLARRGLPLQQLRSFHWTAPPLLRQPHPDVPKDVSGLGMGLAFMNQFLLKEIMKAMWIVTIYTFRQPSVTIHYPYERNTKSTRFRGEHALLIYPDGDERCITCQLCEVTCPAQAIAIDGVEDDDGSRMASRFDLDMHKCIYCGLCQEACPVDAIVETPHAEFCSTEYDSLLYDKARLLENGIRWTSAIEYMVAKERSDFPTNSQRFKS